MSVIFLLLPVALVIVGAAVGAFVWAARRGQYDDLDTPAVRMLHDEVEPPRNDREPSARERGDGRPRE